MRWHYTIGGHLVSIISDGFIRPADTLVFRPERPITWFTTSENWEETANKGGLVNGKWTTLSREETGSRYGGLFRIGVGDDYPLRRFMRITLESRQDFRLTDALIDSARRVGSDPFNDWWGTFHKVRLEHCAAIHRFTPEGWQALEMPETHPEKPESSGPQAA